MWTSSGDEGEPMVGAGGVWVMLVYEIWATVGRLDESQRFRAGVPRLLRIKIDEAEDVSFSFAQRSSSRNIRADSAGDGLHGSPACPALASANKSRCLSLRLPCLRHSLGIPLCLPDQHSGDDSISGWQGPYFCSLFSAAL